MPPAEIWAVSGESEEGIGMTWCTPICFQVEALQREVCVRNSYWQQQRQREEDILSDLDSSLFKCLIRGLQADQVSRGEALFWFEIFNIQTAEYEPCLDFWTLCKYVHGCTVWVRENKARQKFRRIVSCEWDSWRAKSYVHTYKHKNEKHMSEVMQQPNTGNKPSDVKMKFRFYSS